MLILLMMTVRVTPPRLNKNLKVVGRRNRGNVMVEKICGTCKYFAPYDPGYPTVGTCHNAPPVAEDVGRYLFPTVKEKDWCGQWKTKQSR